MNKLFFQHNKKYIYQFRLRLEPNNSEKGDDQTEFLKLFYIWVLIINKCRYYMYKGGFGVKCSKTDGQCPFISRKHKQQAGHQVISFLDNENVNVFPWRMSNGQCWIFMKESMLCTTYMYLSNPPKIIIDSNFQAVNLKKDKKKLFLISTTIFFLEMLVLSYQRYAQWGLLYV